MTVALAAPKMLSDKPEAVKIAVREAGPGDTNFVYSSWLKSYRSAYSVKHVPNPIYFGLHHKLIEHILSRDKTQLLIACAPEDQHQILGYLVVERVAGAEKTALVHYVYVKQPLRQFGVAKALLKAADVDDETTVFATHVTSVAMPVLERYGWVYNPYLAYSH